MCETGAVPEGAVGIIIDVSVRWSQHQQFCLIFVKCQGSICPLLCHDALLSASTAGIEGSDDDALVAGEQDEELSRWEQEQIRKGINIPQVRERIQLQVLKSKF